MGKQSGLFDEEMRLRKLSELGDSLEKLGCIDWEMFRPIIGSAFDKKGKSKAGRPPFDYVMMFKILVLQRFYNISDDQTEYMINDRMSFQRFLGLTLADKVPDAKTIWAFRETLAQKNKMRNLFKKFSAELERSGIIAHETTLIDATFVDAPKQRNSRSENKDIKDGRTPGGWLPSAGDTEAELLKKKHRLSRKDLSARWTTKNREKHYGYKDHVKVDGKTKLITGYEVTSASVHDSQVFSELMDEHDRLAYVDSGYSGKEPEGKVPGRIDLNVCKKGARYVRLTEADKLMNHLISKIRCRIEHVFGYMTNSMNGLTLRSVGKKRAEANIGLTNLVYNMFRYSVLLKKAA